jgi:hypothetical protein
VWVLKAGQGREGRKSTVGDETWDETVHSDARRRGRMGGNTGNCFVAVLLGRKVGPWKKQKRRERGREWILPRRDRAPTIRLSPVHSLSLAPATSALASTLASAAPVHRL